MRKYFGTDGIRRIANSELTPELVYKVAKAGAYVLSKHTNHTPTIFYRKRYQNIWYFNRSSNDSWIPKLRSKCKTTWSEFQHQELRI